MTRTLGIDFSWQQALLAIPAALALTMIAGLASARSAARTLPMDALRPPILVPRGGSRAVTGPVSLGLNQVARRPTRLLLGTLAVALPVAASTLLGSVIVAFQGAVVGSFLGDAISLQVRTPDLIAAGFLALLGLAAVAITAFLTVQEDARSYAALSAVGWSDSRLGAAVVTQGALVGLSGALVGAGVGVALVWGLTGHTNLTVLATAALSGLIAMVLSAATAFAPAAALRRLPTSRILAAE